MFNYKEFESETLLSGRVYNIDGKKMPSITTVLSKTQSEESKKSLEKWKNALGEKADQISREAAANGTALHELIEKYVSKLPFNKEDYSPKVWAGFNAVKIKLNKINEIWAQEKVLYSAKLQIAGRSDCVGIFRSLPAIIDYKTSSRIKNKNQIEDYFLQVTAYALMHNEMFNTEIKHGVIIMSSEFSFPQEFVIEIDKYTDQLKRRIDLYFSTYPET